jgi:PAS domain S-box-containing protein
MTGPGGGRSHDALGGYRFELVWRDAVLATWRGSGPGDAGTILIVGAASEAAVRTATGWLDHELSLRERLDPAWARVPAASAWHAGAMVLVYPDDGAMPLAPPPAAGFALDRFFAYAVAMARTLAAAHAAGINHRALAPSSYLFGREGDCRLAGFGQAAPIEATARRTPPTAPSAAPSVLPVMPPQTMSPEHSGRTGLPVEARSDLYSLGVILFQFATGKMPFRIAEPETAAGWIHAHLASEPASASQLRPELPPMLCRILARLLAKAPEERYQGAHALAADLARCRRAWAAHRAVPAFTLGAGEQGAALAFPARLYGRDGALVELTAAYARAGAERTLGVSVVHGPSGSGKTALLAAFLDDPRLRQAVVIRARADQYGGEAPYAALADGLRRLVTGILAHSEAAVAHWRARVAAELRDPAPGLGLVPELALLLDGAPPAAGSPAAGSPVAAFDGGARVADTVLGLLRAFATPERPLVLVVDNVQWLDPAAALLLEQVVGLAVDLPVMLVLATRSHMGGAPARQAALGARLAGRAAFFHEIALDGLPLPVLERLLADIFGAQPDIAALSALVRQKTAGHPYFVRQFVQAIADDGQVRHVAGAWRFDLDQVAARGFTDNMAGLALQRLARLPATLHPVLGAIAILGQPGGAALLARVFGVDAVQLAASLAPALAAQVLVQDGGAYAFTHERLQEAAYQLVDAASLSRLHYLLARLLADQAALDRRDDTLFRAAGHLAHAQALVEPGAALAFAQLAARAGGCARRSCAYTAALGYLGLALQLLARAPVSSVSAALAFDYEQELAQCLFLAGRLEDCAALVERLLAGPAGRRARGRLHSLAIDLEVRRGRYREASRIALGALHEAGIEIPADPGQDDRDRAYAAVRAGLGVDPQARLQALPPLADADIAVAFQLLTSAMVAAALTAPRLLFMQMCETLQLTLRHGMTADSVAALAWFGVRVCEHYQAYEDGFAYGQAARHLVKQHGYASHEAQVLLALDQLGVWTQPLEFSLECAQDGFAAGRAQGDVTTACFAACHRTCLLLARGDHLDSVREAIEQAHAFVAHAGFADVETVLRTQLYYVDHLRTVAKEGAPGADLERDMPGAANAMAPLRFWRWIYLATARYLEGNLGRALACLDEAALLAWSAPAYIHLLDLHLFSVLAVCGQGADKAAARRARAVGHLAQIRAWAASNPVTFTDKLALAEGALHEFDGDDLAAQDCYERAADHAGTHGVEHIAGIAHERAALLAARRRQSTAAGAHAQAASRAYRRWGALGKVALLEAAFPPVAEQGGTVLALHADTAAIRDIDSVIRSARALSEEIHAVPLVQTLMKIALQTANAQRGLLIRRESGGILIQASARLTADGIEVDMGQVAPTAQDLPLTMVNTVMRTRQPLSVSDSRRPAPYARDPYLAAYPRCAAIAIPMMKRAQLVGMLYLENRLSSYGFTGEHTQVLSLLAAQAAVSLETAQLYAELLEENRERRRVEKALRESRATLLLGERINRSGSWIWDVARSTLDCSAECCRIFGLDPVPGRIALDTLMARIHPRDRDNVARSINDAVGARRPMRFEQRVAASDGRVRYLSVVGQPADDIDGVFVGTVSDITRRRIDEEALRKAQAELAHGARVATVGQLTAAIAHEVNQPLMSITANAGAALRWLRRAPPALDRVAGLLQDIGGQSQRAGKIIQTLQELGHRSPQFGAVDLHALLRETLGLARADLQRHEVALELELEAGASRIDGDAVQLRQVVVNLVNNAVEAMMPVLARRRVLRIVSRCGNGRIEVRFEDNGVGVAASGIDTMFEPFVSTKPDGIGMGLAVCRSIVEAHGGAIRAEAGRPYGCSVSVELPGGC